MKSGTFILGIILSSTIPFLTLLFAFIKTQFRFAIDVKERLAKIETLMEIICKNAGIPTIKGQER